MALLLGYTATLLAAFLIFFSSSSSENTEIYSVFDVYNYLDNSRYYGKNSYETLKTFNDQQYLIINKYATLKEAKAFCRKFKGHLVTITTKEEEKFLADFLKENQTYWAGGKTFSPIKNKQYLLTKKEGQLLWSKELSQSSFKFICEWSPSHN